MARERYRPAGGRRGLRAGVTLAGFLIACFLPAAAGAAVVTIGTPTASFVAGQSSAGCNCTQYQLTAPDGYVETAPADGVIVGWRVAGTGTLTLEALRMGPAGLSIVGLSTAGQSASTGAFPLQPVHIPVLAGDSIGVHLSGTSPKVYNTGPLPGATIGEAAPDVPATLPNLQTPGGAIFLNADVAITPVVTGISPASGPTGGGTVVTITGNYLDGTTGVKFGALNASSFTVLSPTQIIASTPIQPAGVVDVRVSGPGAASAISAADQFTYVTPVTPISSSVPIPPGSSSGSVLGSPGSGLVLSPLALSASYFLAAPSGASIAKATPIGTTVRYTVSAPATTRFTIQRALAGRLLPATLTSHGVGTCAAPTQATVRQRRPACTRYVSLSPQLTHADKPGLNAARLSGRLNGHPLAPGSYRLLASATSTGNPTRVSATVSHAFRIAAPPSSTTKAAAPKAHAALPGT